MRTPGPLESRANPSSSSGTATSRQGGLGRDLLPSESLSSRNCCLPAHAVQPRSGLLNGARKGTLSRRFLFQGAFRGCSSEARCLAAWQEVCATRGPQPEGKERKKGSSRALPIPGLPPCRPGPEGSLGPRQQLPTAPRWPAAWQPQDTCSAESGSDTCRRQPGAVGATLAPGPGFDLVSSSRNPAAPSLEGSFSGPGCRCLWK